LRICATPVAFALTVAEGFTPIGDVRALADHRVEDSRRMSTVMRASAATSSDLRPGQLDPELLHVPRPRNSSDARA